MRNLKLHKGRWNFKKLQSVKIYSYYIKPMRTFCRTICFSLSTTTSMAVCVALSPPSCICGINSSVVKPIHVGTSRYCKDFKPSLATRQNLFFTVILEKWVRDPKLLLGHDILSYFGVVTVFYMCYLVKLVTWMLISYCYTVIAMF